MGSRVFKGYIRMEFCITQTVLTGRANGFKGMGLSSALEHIRELWLKCTQGGKTRQNINPIDLACTYPPFFNIGLSLGDTKSCGLLPSRSSCSVIFPWCLLSALY